MWPPLFIEEPDFMCSLFIEELFIDEFFIEELFIDEFFIEECIDECIESAGFGEAALI